MEENIARTLFHNLFTKELEMEEVEEMNDGDFSTWQCGIPKETLRKVLAGEEVVASFLPQLTRIKEEGGYRFYSLTTHPTEQVVHLKFRLYCS